MAVETQSRSANAFKTIVDTIVSPKEAFESIREVPTWGIAMAVAIVLAAVGSYLMVPALQHGMAGSWSDMVAKSPQLSQMTPEQQHAQLALSEKIYGFTWIFVIVGMPIFMLIEAVVMLVFDKLGRGDGSFGKYFAAAANIAVIGGIGQLITGIIAALRGPESFTSLQAVQNTMPTFALLVPGAAGKLAAFLAVFTPFSLWATGLVIAAMVIVGRVPKLQAWLAGLLLLVVPALLASLGAK
ncbi:MAG TPA: YIP1 family protein [Candidatus Aquilonibacter sp.]|nr:YIP1 family protein [Candidatus Aquilonibacter sp.]